MRILHLAARVGLRFGGMEAVVCGLARGQRSLGCEVTVWTLDSPTAVEEAATENRLEGCIVRCPSLGPSSLGYSPLAERMIAGAAASSIDVWHQHGIWTATSRVTSRWRSCYQRPTVITLHGMLEPYALNRSKWKKQLAGLFYEKENLARASCLHAVSLNEVESLRQFGLRNPIAVIANGVSESWLSSQGSADRFCAVHSIPKEKRVLLFLSRIHPIKGLPLLFEALSSARRQLMDCVLVIAGSDDRRHQAKLQSLARKLAVEDMIQFVGPLIGQEKRDAYEAADLFILPSWSEGFPVVILEALAAGVPVLTTEATSWNELEMYRCGWRVAREAGAIQKALIEAIQLSKNDLKEMGQRGNELVKKHYTWSMLAEKSVELYLWLLRGGREPEFVLMS